MYSGQKRMPDHESDSGRLGFLHQDLCFGGIGGEWFFTEHRLPGRDGFPGRRHMQKRRQADIDKVRFNRLQGFRQGFEMHRVHAQFLELGQGGRGVGIDDRDDIGLGKALVDLGVHPTHETESNQDTVLHDFGYGVFRTGEQ